MITREEFEREFNKIDIIEGCTIGYHCDQTNELVYKYTNQLEQRIKSLEAQLSNTEQLTCETCKENNKCHFNESAVHFLSWKFNRQCEDKEFGCIYHNKKDTK